MEESSKTLGDRAEIAAIQYLQKYQYEIIETNFVASKGGEVDIIAKKEGITIFFEVKYRSSSLYGSAVETFTRTKKRRFLFAVKWYCLKYKISEEYIQIDFIAIQKRGIRHELTHFKKVDMS